MEHLPFLAKLVFLHSSRKLIRLNLLLISDCKKKMQKKDGKDVEEKCGDATKRCKDVKMMCKRDAKDDRILEERCNV